MAFEPTLALDALWIGEMRGVRVGGKPVLLVRLEDGLHVFEDRCAHLGVPLSRGTLKDGVITCSAHQYCYDACSGAGINPKTVTLKPLAHEVREGIVYVSTAAAPGGPT